MLHCNFYFSLNTVDSASTTVVASILSCTSSYWNNSFWIFLTSPICHVSEFQLKTGSQEQGTVICTISLQFSGLISCQYPFFP